MKHKKGVVPFCYSFRNIAELLYQICFKHWIHKGAYDESL